MLDGKDYGNPGVEIHPHHAMITNIAGLRNSKTSKTGITAISIVGEH